METRHSTRPDHYKTGQIEPITYMKAKMTPEMYEGFLLGNVLKYVSRYSEKNGVEDLEKARVYLNWMIEDATERETKNALQFEPEPRLCDVCNSPVPEPFYVFTKHSISLGKQIYGHANCVKLTP